MSDSRAPARKRALKGRFARMAELADALDSGSSRGNPVEVRVLFRALFGRNLVMKGARALARELAMKGCSAHVLKLADRLV
jgi:hypothetical protein